MSKIIQKNRPCLNGPFGLNLDPDKCSSHDARQVYHDWTSFCFSCKSWFKPSTFDGYKEVESEDSISTEIKVDKKKSVTAQLTEIEELPIRGFQERKIPKQICEFFGVKVSYDEDGQIERHYYPYGDDSNRGYKVRRLPKEFYSVGNTNDLFGRDKFSSGGKRLIVTEGEIDALSVAYALWKHYNGTIYPVVALPSASSTKELLKHREWIRSFDEVVLCLDNDDPGKKATSEAIKIIGIEKAKVAKFKEKDPNAVLLKYDDHMPLLRAIWDAQPWSPAGIINKDELWERLQSYNKVQSHPYPECLRGVNTKLKGQRPGEIVLLISGTGSGKSTIIREMVLHDLETTSDKVGIVSLEESPEETARKLAGMYIKRNPADEEIPIEELKVGFDKIFGEERTIILDHQGSISDGSIIDQLEYMCLSGCKYIFIDHITILVSEGADGLTGNEAIDKIMNDLLRVAKRHNVWIGLVSHLRKTMGGGKSFEEGKLPSIDDIRGSGSIKQVSFDIIAFARDLTAEDEAVRNTIKMAILKSRYTGLTGPVPGAYYDHKTGRLKPIEAAPPEKFEVVNGD